MNRKIVLIASLVAGLLAALLTSVYISGKEEYLLRLKKKLAEENKKSPAVCFSRDISAGSEITMDDLCVTNAYERHGIDIVRPGEESQIVGKRVVGHFDSGMPVRWTYVDGGRLESGRLSDRIQSDRKGSYRAMSISVTGSSSVSGLIRKGDFVDVIGTFDFPDDAGKIKRGDPVTCTVLQRVEVLATGNDRPETRSLGVAQSARPGGYSLVTLLVTPREAEILAFAEHIKGRLMLTLRNRGDLYAEPDLPVISFEEIRQELTTLNEARNHPRPKKGQ
ncbi:MAG: Flp pilus assembly protein CpaB [Kiritimatiellia bacterium]